MGRYSQALAVRRRNSICRGPAQRHPLVYLLYPSDFLEFSGKLLARERARNALLRTLGVLHLS